MWINRRNGWRRTATVAHNSVGDRVPGHATRRISQRPADCRSVCEAEERRRRDDRAVPVSRLLVDSALAGEVSLVTGEQLLQLQQAVELVADSLAGIEHERPQRWAAMLEGVVPIVERLIVERAP